ncbi:MAG TPA: MFS transporter [Jatrophihabitantaceae bacterium]|nr:MFS transporter [Jatrophihabitantaceae bacterium]
MSFRIRLDDLPLVITAKAVSFLGDELATVALMLRLQSSGAGPGAVAILLIANLAPIVLLAGPVGQLVDRYDNRRLLVISSLVQAGICVALTTSASPIIVLPLVAALGAGQAVNGATWQALIPAVVGEQRLARALSRSQAANTTAGIAAPALSGLLTGTFGARVPLLIDAVTFLAVLGAALLMQTRRAVRGRTSARLPGGLGIVRRAALLRTSIALLALFVLLGSMVNVVDVFLVRETLGASTTWYGISAAGYSIGVLVGALAAGRLTSTTTLARAMLGSAALLGLGLAAMGLAPGVVWLTAFGLAAGAMNGVLSVAAGAMIMGNAAPGERGRVAAVLGAAISGTQLGAYAAGGILAASLGPRGVFVLGGCLAMLAPLVTGRPLLRSAAERARATCRADVVPAGSG